MRMTFDLTPEQQALVSGAGGATALPAGALNAVLVVEARAAAEGGEAAMAALGGRGHAEPRLMAAAAVLGVGRAAVEHAVRGMKQAGVAPGPDETTPYWTLADGATDVAAARVLICDAAQLLDRGEDAGDAVTRALALATAAAQRAVDAAIEVAGADGFGDGGLLDRLLRDARTLSRG